MSRILWLLFLVGLGIAGLLGGQTASAAIGQLGSDQGPSNSFLFGRPGFEHHLADWNVPNEDESDNAGPELRNPFIPAPARIFLSGNRGGYYGTLLQTLRFGIMPEHGYSIGLLVTPILFTPGGKSILPSSQANWIVAGAGEVRLLDWVLRNTVLLPGSLPGRGGAAHVASSGGSAGPGGIGGGGGGGAQRTASTNTGGSGSGGGSNPDSSLILPTLPILDRTITPTILETPSEVPIPGAFLLFGSGLAGVLAFGRRKRA